MNINKAQGKSNYVSRTKHYDSEMYKNKQFLCLFICDHVIGRRMPFRLHLLEVHTFSRLLSQYSEIT